MPLYPSHVFSELRSTTKRNEKIAILTKHSKDENLQECLRYMLDPFFVFGIKKIPDYTPSPSKLSFEDQWDRIYFLLDQLRERKVTGHAAVHRFEQVLNEVDEENAEALVYIIKKNPDCGLNTSTVNAVLGAGFIPEFDVMLCTAYSEKALERIEYPAYSQLKMDGARMVAYVDKQFRVKLLTRNGKEYHQLDSLKTEIQSIAQNLGLSETYFDGELVFQDMMGEWLDRKTSNGLANQSMKETLPTGSKPLYIVWDVYNPGESTDYAVRFKKLQGITSKSKRMQLVESEEVDSVEAARDHFLSSVENGHEGIVLKNKKGPWEGKRTKNMVKFKEVYDCDLLVTRWIEGTGKYKGMLGAVEAVDSSGEFVVHIGSGFKDRDREMKPKDIVGKIIEIEYNQKIEAKNRESKSLFLPVFQQVREDKDVPDDLTQEVTLANHK